MNQLGLWGEQQACQYFIQKAYCFVEKNYYCKQGEIDLIFLKNKIHYFIEVKTRLVKTGSRPFMEDVFPVAKQRRFWKAVCHYLSVKEISDAYQMGLVVVWGKEKKWTLSYYDNVELLI